MNAIHRLVTACACLASAVAVAGVTPGVAAAQTCDVNTTTANFATDVGNATNGDTLCLASGDYGTWRARKTITLTPQAGATPTIALNFGCGSACGTLSQADGPTLDGLTIAGGTITGDTANYASFSNEPQNITIRNSTFTGSLVIDGVEDANILLDGNTHEDIDYPDAGSGTVNCSVPPAAIHLAYRDAIESGVTIQNSLFEGGNKDGIQGSAGVQIIGNEFSDIGAHGAVCASNSEAPHTDALQLTGATGSVVRGNWLHGNDDGIVAFDGISDVTMENNAIGPDQDSADCIALYSAVDTMVRHNTCSAGLGIYLDHKSGGASSSGNTIRDNIAPNGLNGPDMAAGATKTNNLYAGASAPDLNGSPTFVGGSSPTSYAGFKLTAGSDGRHAASDGLNVGVVYDIAPPTLISETQVSSWTTIDSSKATSSFNAQAGDVIVVYGMTEDQPISLSVSGGSLTWTELQRVNVSNYGRAYAWTATVDSNKTMSVTCTRGALSGSYGCDALLFRDSAGVGASAKTNAASGSPSLSLTTVGDNSAVVVGDVDWNAASGASRAWRTTAGAFTEEAYATLTGHYTVYGGVHPDVDAAGAKTVGLTAPSQKYSMVAVEVQGL
jgi:hypothetical protein